MKVRPYQTKPKYMESKTGLAWIEQGERAFLCCFKLIICEEEEEEICNFKS